MSIQLKRGLTADINQDLVLLDGQPGVEKRTDKSPRLKIGDGTSKWSALAYASPDSEIYKDSEIIYKTNSSFSVTQDGSDGVVFENNTLSPSISASSNLGGRARWASGYFTGVNISGGNVVPVAGSEGTIGSTKSRWASGYFTGVDISGNNVIPAADQTGSLGSSDRRWQYGRFEGLDINEVNTGVITPSSTDTGGLGSSTYRFNSGYINTLNVLSIANTGSISVTNTLYPTSTNYDLGNATAGQQWGRVCVANATGTTFSTTSNGLCFGTGNYPVLQHYSTSLYFNPAGTSNTSGRLTLSTGSLYPTTSGGSSLGQTGHGWTNLVLSGTGTLKFTSGTGTTATIRSAISEATNPVDTSKYNLYIGGTYSSNLFYANTDYAETHIVGESIEFNMPDMYRAIIIGNDTTSGFYLSGYDNSTGTSKPSLGRTNQRWGTVYCVSVSESSDSKDKSDIQYITSNSVNSNTTTRKARAKAASVSNDSSSTISTEDVISFVKNCSPATFVYKGVQNAPATVSEAITSSPEAVHLGLIADDIENDVVFPFIGAKSEFTEDDGTKTSQLSLKPLSIAVAALTACKYLLNEVEILKNQLNSLSN